MKTSVRHQLGRERTNGGCDHGPAGAAGVHPRRGPRLRRCRCPAPGYYNGVAGYNLFTRTAASYVGLGFISFEPWDERREDALSASAILASLNAEFATIAEARVFAMGPPAIPGISAAGGFSMMIQDRSGGSFEVLAENVQRFVAEARTRPELAGVRPSFSPSVPQLFARVDKEEALKQGVAITELYAALQTFLGGACISDYTHNSAGNGAWLHRQSRRSGGAPRRSGGSTGV